MRSEHLVTQRASHIEHYFLAQGDETSLHILWDRNWQSPPLGFLRERDVKIKIINLLHSIHGAFTWLLALTS